MGDKVVVLKLSWLEEAPCSELAVSIFILCLTCSAVSFNISAILVRSEDLFHSFQHLGLCLSFLTSVRALSPSPYQSSGITVHIVEKTKNESLN